MLERQIHTIKNYHSRPQECMATLHCQHATAVTASYYFLKPRQDSGLFSLNSCGGQVYAAMQHLVRSVQFPKWACGVRERNSQLKYGTVYSYSKLPIDYNTHIVMALSSLTGGSYHLLPWGPILGPIGPLGNFQQGHSFTLPIGANRHGLGILASSLNVPTPMTLSTVPVVDSYVLKWPSGLIIESLEYHLLFWEPKAKSQQGNSIIFL